MQPKSLINNSVMHPSRKEWKSEAHVEYDQNNPPPKTRGEKVFNALTWGFFGWVINAGASIMLADLYQTRFRKQYVEWGKSLSEVPIVKSIFKNETESFSRSFMSVLALLPGGYTVIAPIKFLEDRKLATVKMFDAWFGPKNETEGQSQIKEARYSYIEQQPKISWWNLFDGRTVPVAMVLGTHFAFANKKTNVINAVTRKETFKGLDHHYGE